MGIENIDKKDVQIMHLGDVLHYLELACYPIEKYGMEKYRQPLCEMLMEVIEMIDIEKGKRKDDNI